MAYFTEFIPRELIEIILVYATEETSLLDLYDIGLFNDILLSPAFIKMIFDHKNYEIVNKDIALYASFDKSTIKKFKKYKSRQLINIINTEYSNVDMAHISYKDIKSNNIDVEINIEYINDMSLLYDYIVLDEEIELDYMDSKWSLFLHEESGGVKFQSSEIQLRMSFVGVPTND